MQSGSNSEFLNTPGNSSLDPRWYYRSQGRDVGPLSTEQFLRAIREQSVVRETKVRLSDSTVWMLASEIDGITFPDDGDTRESSAAARSNQEMRQLFAECVRKQSQSAQSRKATKSAPVHTARSNVLTDYLNDLSHSFGGGLAGLLEILWTLVKRVATSKIAWAIGALCALVVLVPLLPRLGVTWVTQRQALDTLTKLSTECRTLRVEECSEEQWSQFQRRAQQELATLLPHLKAQAKTEDPASMSLMWIARDFLPRALNSRKASLSEVDEKIESQLHVVKTAFRKAKVKPASVDWFTIGIVTVDIVVVVGVAAVLLLKSGWQLPDAIGWFRR